MGMSASQARMLSLTSRLSDLEYSAQSISNSKIRLADSSTEVSRAYQDALDKEKLTVMSSSTSTYVDASAYNLTTYGAVSSTDKQRFLKDSSDRVLVTSKVGNAFDSSQNTGSVSYYLKNEAGRDTDGDGVDDTFGFNTAADFLRDSLGYSTQDEAQTAGVEYDAKQVAYYNNLYSGKEEFLNSLGYTTNPEEDTEGTAGTGYKNIAGATRFYSNVFEEIAQNGYNSPGDDNMNDPEWLYSQLSSGNIFLSEWVSDAGKLGTGAFTEVSWSSGDATLVTKKDDSTLAKAEAEYETKMAEIKSKDNRYDLQLKQIDTEHNAIQTEIDSVKKVIEKNVDRTFKIFSA